MSMRIVSAIAAIALFLGGGCATPTSPTGSAEARHSVTTAITHVTVIDGTGAPAKADQTVLVRDGRIAAIGRAGRIRVDPGFAVVDGSGKFLIPGLWNMHVHAVSYDQARGAFPTLLDAGITGVRDMGAPLEEIVRLRDEVRSGAILGPHMVVAGPLVQGPLPFNSKMVIQVREAGQAAATISYLRSKGVDFIKVHDALPDDIYRAVALESKRQGIRFAGHVPPPAGAVEASELGQASIEHLGGQFDAVLIASSTREEHFRELDRGFYTAGIAALRAGSAPGFDHLKAAFIRPLLQSYDERKAAALMERFRRNGTWQCPTLVALPSIWDEHSAELSPEDRQAAADLLARDSKLVGLMQRKGVGLLAGTDGSYPGAGTKLYEELALLVAAGLTPMQALQTATSNPARFLGLNDLGTVEAGKQADLVLLDGNPLLDIANIRRVHAVFLAGKLWDRTKVPLINAPLSRG